jgi:FkbM family methyltransferase
VRSFLELCRFITSHPLPRSKVAALYQFVIWQLGARLLRKKVVVPWVDESRFVCGIGEAGLTGNLYAGFMEYKDMLFLLHSLSREEVFVDIGANVGAYTILASKCVQAKTIAFEPIPETVERLLDQIQINRVSDLVSVRNKGVAEDKGTLYFSNSHDTVNRVIEFGGSECASQVEVVSIDQELPRGQRYFFKIDVEGYELNVIKGGADVLSSPLTSVVIIEMNGSGESYGHTNQDVHTLLVRLGFSPCSYEPFSRSLKKLSNFNDANGNMIYVRNISEISARCRGAPLRKIHTAGGVEV